MAAKDMTSVAITKEVKDCLTARGKKGDTYNDIISMFDSEVSGEWLM